MATWYAKSFRKGTNAFAKYYDGNQWVKKAIKFYDGTTWTTRNGSPTDIRAQLITDSTSQTALGATKFWNGSAWQVVDALAQESYDIVARGTQDNTTISVTVGSKTGGGNAFYFNGYERRSTTVKQGATITFDTTNSDNSHPFKLSTTADGTHGSGGSSYNSGVLYILNGQSVTESNYVTNYSIGADFSTNISIRRGIIWTVPNTSTTLYYYCTVHSGMGSGATITTSTTGEISSVDEGDSVYFHITGRDAGETLYYEIISYLPSSNVRGVNFANDFSAPSSSSGTITTGTDKVGILQVTTSADADTEGSPQDFQIEIYSDFNGSKGDLERFSNVITINDTSTAANPTTAGSYNNTYLGETTSVAYDTFATNSGILSFDYTIPSNTSVGHYYFVLWGGYDSSSYKKSTPNDAYGTFMTRFTLSLQINKDTTSSVAVPTIYDSTELGFTKVTTPNNYHTINQVQVTNNTSGVSIDTGKVVPDASTSVSQIDDNYALDTVIHASPGDSLSFNVRMTSLYNSAYLRWNHTAF